jgi:hypothetical protein
MVNNRTLNRRPARPRRVGQWLAMCVAVGALLPVVGDAQAPRSVTLKAGLHHFGGGNIAVLTVVEAGASGSTAGTSVTIEFFDAKDQRRGSRSATLLQGKPVQLQVQIPATVRYEQLRPVVFLKPGSNFLTTRPTAVFEELEIDTLRAATKGGGCSPGPLAQYDPAVDDNAQGDCTGWNVTRATSFQSN